MVYKYYDASIGKQLYEKYKSGIITSEEMFLHRFTLDDMPIDQKSTDSQ